jgi:transposase
MTWDLVNLLNNSIPIARSICHAKEKRYRLLLKEGLERLWTYRYEGAMVRYLQSWIDQLRWQRLPPFQRLAQMLADHLDGILNYCRTKVRFGVVEAINGNLKTLLRRGRGYKNLAYLLLKAQRMAVTKTEFIVLQKAA